MKVLMINVVCGIRSTGRICTDLAEELEKQGHKVKIAYGREEVPEKYKKFAIRIGNTLDVNLHALRARIMDDAGCGSRWYTGQFIKWVKEYDPDVIHLHNIHGYYINAEVLFNYLRTCGKRIIWTLHDCWAFTGHSVFCDAINCTRWKRGCHHCPQIKEYPKSYVDKSRINWIRKKKIFVEIPNLEIVTPSYWLADLVKNSYLKSYPVTVIHNGVDTNQFYPISDDLRLFYGWEDKFIILAVASTWNQMKGFNDYIKLAGMLGDRYKIVLVGVTKMQKAALPKGIFGIERTTSTKELAMIYSASDVFLNLTYCDTFPTVNLEAIACGLYVIAYDTGGCAESIDGKGSVVKRGNLSAVVTELDKMFESKIMGKKQQKNKDGKLVKDKKEAITDYMTKYTQRGHFGKDKCSSY